MKQFGSLKRLRAATVEELTTVPGIGRRTAEAVLAAVAGPATAGESGDVDEGVPGPEPEPDGGTGVAVHAAGEPHAGDTPEIGRVQWPAGTGA
jgi:excinuclease ABC subunit C